MICRAAPPQGRRRAVPAGWSPAPESGSLTTARVPRPGSELKVSRPPWPRTSEEAIASPSPVPPALPFGCEERIAQPREVLGRDADALIAHLQHDRAFFGVECGGDPDPSVPVGQRLQDVLVGCDGIHSVIRRTYFENEGAPKWNGVTMWRALTEAAPFLSGRTMVMIGQFGRQMIVYPISRRHEAEGRALINWVADVRKAPDQPMPTQDWRYTASREDVLEAFKSFIFDFLDAPALIRDAEAIYQYPRVDRDPLPTWNFGRVTLLGDAAHPMYPVGSNCLVMPPTRCIPSARTAPPRPSSTPGSLARELALQPSIEEAIAAYDAQRRPQTAGVVLANRQGGPERCIEIVEQRAPNGFVDLEAVISHEELEVISRSYKLTAGFDPEVLNNRPSLGIGQQRRSPPLDPRLATLTSSAVHAGAPAPAVAKNTGELRSWT